MRFYVSLLFSFLFAAVALAQDTPTPYEIALQRIEEAEATGAIYFTLGFAGLTEIPPEIGNLINLQILDLSYNMLSSLPSEINNLSHLQELILHNNQFSNLPPEIANLITLQRLDLD